MTNRETKVALFDINTNTIVSCINLLFNATNGLSGRFLIARNENIPKTLTSISKWTLAGLFHITS